MKTKNFLPCLILALTLVSGASRAADLPPAPAPEMAAMEQFLDLSDAELGQLQEVIARLRAMTPAQRSALRAEVTRYRQLPAARREQLRQGWGGMSAELQEGWRELMHSATPERRNEIQQALQALSPEEKTAYRQRLVEDYLKAKAGAPTK